MNLTGIIIASYGTQFVVNIDNKHYTAITKNKHSGYVVGDIVDVCRIDNETLQIINLCPRKSIVFRESKDRQKLIASNVTQLLIIIAIKPNFNSQFLDSCLVFAHWQNIKPIIVINKTDMHESHEFIKKIKDLYQHNLKYDVITVSAINNDYNQLMDVLFAQSSLLIGHSGVGKSTLINKVFNINTRTNSLTATNISGKHTTTNSYLYTLNNNSFVIDSPGMNEFGLHSLKKIPQSILLFFPEFIDLVNNCKYRNCRHFNEKDCAIINYVANNPIYETRLKFLQYIINN